MPKSRCQDVGEYFCNTLLESMVDGKGFELRLASLTSLHRTRDRVVDNADAITIRLQATRVLLHPLDGLVIHCSCSSTDAGNWASSWSATLLPYGTPEKSSYTAYRTSESVIKPRGRRSWPFRAGLRNMLRRRSSVMNLRKDIASVLEGLKFDELSHVVRKCSASAMTTTTWVGGKMAARRHVTRYFRNRYVATLYHRGTLEDGVVRVEERCNPSFRFQSLLSSMKRLGASLLLDILVLRWWKRSTSDSAWPKWLSQKIEDASYFIIISNYHEIFVN
ncbi:hypothetical protein CAPTEDRAFT_184846 [Capitella teleta]|uniref:TIR domain-containing protein n=1 Tax=Capitella teleta TaxID=283909 RepID=R7V8Q6_CAPTE|nr:hypothetical protein CAPTEDRAFT_184846 [Capitella teleta]|eukprot:ELU14954.1 hypothetical protein CAPTEDRAFT_184846 [Capitella teleta]